MRRTLQLHYKLTPCFLKPFVGRKPARLTGLGHFVYKTKYARITCQETQEQEDWTRTVTRVVEGTGSMLERYAPEDCMDIKYHMEQLFSRIWNLVMTPPGRGLWAMGSPMTEEKRLYASLNNCGFTSTQNLTSAEPFSFLMDMAMLGVGMGFDTRGAGQLRVHAPLASATVSPIEDNREGWVRSVSNLLNSYLVPGSPAVAFDYSAIRPPGSPIVHFGGRTRGAPPLIDLHRRLRKLLGARVGQSLSSRDIVDIMNLIGRAVVTAGARSTAEIAFGYPWDKEFLDLKNYAVNPDRAEYGWTSNNSVFAEVGMDYSGIAERVRDNGEPGFLWLETARKYGRLADPPNWSDRNAMGANPCNEQTLEPGELCNLVEVYPNHHASYGDFLDTLTSALIYAKVVTLGPIADWPQTSARVTNNRRLGISLSGIAQLVDRLGMPGAIRWFDGGYKHLVKYDAMLSEALGVPQSIKLTSVKPSGTVSLVAGATPGIHHDYAPYYIRRVRVGVTDPLLIALREAGYRMELDHYDDSRMAVEFPVRSRLRSPKPDMWGQLEMAATLQKWWADNQVSATVTFDPEKDDLAAALSVYDSQLKGVSFLPESPDGPAAYAQMPYEEINKQQYLEMAAELREIDFSGKSAKELQPEMGCDACTI